MPRGRPLSARPALLALIGTVLVAGCADEQESLIVLGAPAWPDGGECVIEADEPDVYLLEGLLDLSFGTGYLMPVVLRNNLPPQQSSNAGVDTNEMVLDDVDVKLVSPQAPEIIDALEAIDPAFVEFTVNLQTISLAPGGTYGQAVEVITAPAAEALSPLVLDQFGPDVTIRLVAKTEFSAQRTGNSVGNVGTVDARTFEFPINVCHGCLLDCSACADQTACPPADTVQFSGFLCGNAQDAPIIPAQCEAE